MSQVRAGLVIYMILPSGEQRLMYDVALVMAVAESIPKDTRRDVLEGRLDEVKLSHNHQKYVMKRTRIVSAEGSKA